MLIPMFDLKICLNKKCTNTVFKINDDEEYCTRCYDKLREIRRNKNIVVNISRSVPPIEFILFLIFLSAFLYWGHGILVTILPKIT